MDGSYDFLKRLLNRRQPHKGWLIMPNTKRESEGGQENKVRDDLNFLLKSPGRISCKYFVKCCMHFRVNSR